MVQAREDSLPYLVFADGEYKKGNIDVALLYYRRSLKSQYSNDTLSSIYYTMGSCFYLKNDYKNAITKFRKAIVLSPGHFKSYNAWGSSLSNLGKYEEAIEKFKKVIDLNTTYTIAYLNRVLALLLQKREEEARKRFEEMRLKKSELSLCEKIYKEEVKNLEASMSKREKDKEVVMKRIESINHLLELIQKKIQLVET